MGRLGHHPSPPLCPGQCLASLSGGAALSGPHSSPETAQQPWPDSPRASASACRPGRPSPVPAGLSCKPPASTAVSGTLLHTPRAAWGQQGCGIWNKTIWSKPWLGRQLAGLLKRGVYLLCFAMPSSTKWESFSISLVFRPTFSHSDTGLTSNSVALFRGLLFSSDLMKRELMVWSPIEGV